ncbi:MAG TPA: alpha/beta hydrolase [Myxococcota bacterium]|jgi:acetyl esterase/lipase
MRPSTHALIALVVAFALAASGCPSLSSFYRGRDDVGASIDLAYVNDGLEKHRLDVYHPRDSKERWPVVVFVHGGYWKGGDKTYWQAITGLYGNAGVALGELGVGTVVTNYRLWPDATLDQMLDDVVGAMKWAHDHVAEMGGDPNRIYLAGHSAGAHLVTLIGSRPDILTKRGFDPAWLKGVVGVSGIYDIPSTVPLVEPELRDGVFYGLFGTDVATQRMASPLFHFSEAMPPTYFIVGENDYRSVKRDYVAAEQQLAPLLGNKAFFKMVPGNTHEDMVLEMGTEHDEVAPAIAAFVRMIEKRDAR